LNCRTDDIAAIAGGEIEDARQALVQKIGENISVRRVGVVTAKDGVVGGYVHGNNRIAVLVELTGGDEELAKDVAMHVAAVNPAVVAPADMPEDQLQKEREIIPRRQRTRESPQKSLRK
jgi:elongation factor Ts